MSSERKIFWAVVAVAVVVVAALLLMPRVEERVAPKPRAAWVAIEVAGSGVAEVGPVSVPAGTAFTLRAVLEAETRRGDPVYYTEAPALSFHGERVPDDRLRPWHGPLTAKVLWFTIEGSVPWLELAPGEGLDRFQQSEFLRTDWPFTWSAPGRLEPAHDDDLAVESAREELPFGTQRYQVRIELYREPSDPVPAERYTSWGKEELPARQAEFPTVTAALPGPAGPASAVFGLTEIQPGRAPQSDLAALEAGGASPLSDRLVTMTRQRLAFARVPLLAEVIAAAGATPRDLGWQRVRLDGALAWDEQVHAGDLLRAGGRMVVLYRDAGAAPAGAGEATTSAAAAPAGDGRLDVGDLCLDYARGAAVRRLGDVFEVGAGGELDWAPLSASR